MARLLQELEDYVDEIRGSFTKVAEERKPVIDELIAYCLGNYKSGSDIKLNFICTHNSRRSQFAQLWAQTAAWFYDLPDVKTYSGGVEVTSFNERAVAAIKRAGFTVVKKENRENPVYFLQYSEDADPVSAFSKVYDDAINAQNNFAAVMTCSEADENCPYIPGAKARIPLRYEDPKVYDDTPLEEEKYDERCRQIAMEMFYIFSKIKEAI